MCRNANCGVRIIHLPCQSTTPPNQQYRRTADGGWRMADGGRLPIMSRYTLIELDGLSAHGHAMHFAGCRRSGEWCAETCGQPTGFPTRPSPLSHTDAPAVVSASFSDRRALTTSCSMRHAACSIDTRCSKETSANWLPSARLHCGFQIASPARACGFVGYTRPNDANHDMAVSTALYLLFVIVHLIADSDSDCPSLSLSPSPSLARLPAHSCTWAI